MEKIISTRLDESVIQQIHWLAHELGTSKKAIIEAAIKLYVQTLQQKPDAFELSCGAWQREETPEATWQQARAAFRHSMLRHQQGEH